MKRKLIAILTALILVGCLAGCEYDNSTSSREADYTATVKKQSLDSVGLPNISNFFEMSQLKTIYELRDNPKLICYWYTKNDMDGKWIYQGKCIGYGIPYSTQMTNPDTTVSEAKGYGGSNSESSVISQAEPNGLYSTGSTSATWILTADNDGNIKPTYVESEITVSQTKIDANKCESWSIPNNY